MNRALVLAGSAILSLSSLILADTASAKELQAGFVITGKNIDEVKNDTFEGKTIGSMLPERLEWQIRNHNLTLPLANSKPFAIDPVYKKLNDANKGKVTLAADKSLVGWEVGQPFPEIDEKDPDAAIKIIYNWVYAPPFGCVLNAPDYQYLLIDGNSGLGRVQGWGYKRMYFQGRWCAQKGEQVLDKDVLFKDFVVAKFPFDLRGLGLLSIKPPSGALPENWVYLRASRRVRKLTGGSWMDPVGATDQLNDDLEIYNAHPLLYKEFKLLGKRWVLAPGHHTEPSWNPDESDQAKKYPFVDLKNAPYWNFINVGYEPREVWVVDAIPPDVHPYKSKVIYMETTVPRPYYAEAYDRNGQFWKYINFTNHPTRSADNTADVIKSNTGVLIDFKRMHATMFVTPKSFTLDDDTKPSAFSLSELEKMGGG